MAHSVRELARRYSGITGEFSVVQRLFGGIIPGQASLHERLEDMAIFRMAVIGDSVMWGQGHQEENKFYTQVRQYLADRLNGRPVEVQVAAHSGAVFGFSDPIETDEHWAARGLSGEIPASFPSIAYQATRQIQQPHAIDLVLMDGGINDVDIRNILSTDPTVGPEWVRKLTRERLRDPLGGVLDLVLTTFPKATIVVTNYFPIVSLESNFPDLAELVLFLFALPALLVTKWTQEKLTKQCQAFHEESTAGMQQAVADANARHDTQRVRFADAGFGANHAMAAADAALYTPSEPDEVGTARKVECDLVYDNWRDLAQLVPHRFCDEANTGHPNPRGMQMYAEAICRELAPFIPAWAAP